MKWKAPSLLSLFALTSFVVVAGLGISIAWFLGRVVEQNALAEAGEEAMQTVSARVVRHLKPEDLAVPMYGQRYDDFHTFVQENVVSGRTARVKLWARDGTVTFSNDRGQVGQRFPIGDELGQALAGQLAMDVSVLQSAENEEERKFGKLLEVYAPVALPGSTDILGAFEIYQYYDPVARAIAATQRDLYTSLAIGLIVLYASLYSIVRRTHLTIIRQQGQLKIVNQAALAVSAEMALEPLMERILQLAAGMVRAEDGALAVLDSQGAFKHFVTTGDNQHGVLGQTPKGRGLLALPIASGKPVRLRNVQAQVAALALPQAHPGLRSFLGIPICYRQRAVGAFYFANKLAAAQFTEEDEQLLERLAAHAALAIEKVGLLEEVEHRAEALEEAYRTTLTVLSSALDLRDGGTESHSQRAAERTRILAEALGVPAEEQESIVIGALLHDIGKIGVPDAVLSKPSSLTEQEWELMRRHPLLGYEMLKPVPFLAGAAPLVRHHHERYDGTGYPDRLSADRIPLGARLFALVDSYDAITSDRPYRKGRSHAEAVAEIVRGAGSQFDPRVVAVFETVAQRFEEPAIEPVRA